MKPFIIIRKTVGIILFSLLATFAEAQVLNINSHYTISSYYANRVLGAKNSSVDINTDIVTYVYTNSNSQKWGITYSEVDQSYTFSNAGSQRKFYLYTAKEGIPLKQGGTLSSGTEKWNIVPVNNSSYPDCYYIINSVLTTDNKKLYLEVPETPIISDTEDQAVRVWSDPEDGTINPIRLWRFTEVEATPNAPTLETVNSVFQAFKLKYYKRAIFGYVLGAPGFWSVAEMLEILLDAYETTGHQEYREMFYNVYENFYKTQGNRNGDWMNNPYNDDLAWIIIACTRAYILFKDQKFITIAKSHFDRMYARSLLPHGGLRWKEGNGDGSNSCINGPAQVAAMYLAKALNDNSYYSKAKSIYDYQYRVLYDPNSGRVYDSALGDEVTNNWASTYNQGTFIGSNLMLYEHFKDPYYLEVAIKVANYTRYTMYGNKVINNESGRDLDGFKGILMRYLRKLIVDYNKSEYISWLHLNAHIAYNNRNTEGIIGTLWGTKTTNTTHDVFAASTAVSLMVNTPLTLNIKKNPFDNIEAEDFDYISGAIAETCPEGTENLGNIQNNYYAGYMNVDFGTKSANKVLFRVSSADTGGTIEVRSGSPSGQLVGSVSVPSTTDWESYVTISCDLSQNLTGLQHIYLVFKGTGYVANLNWFYFEENSTNIIKVHSKNLKIYPNVVNKGEIIHFPIIENGQLSIFSVSGSLIYKKQPYHSNKFSTNDLNPGIYFLKLENDNEIKQSKFIVR